MYSEEDYIQLSAMQHFAFCKRQCALIHIEQVWSENYFTARGRIMHEKVHEEQFETCGNIKIERGMPLVSKRLGLSGKTDVVEFHKDNEGSFLPFPVEYKHGKPKENDCDKVQLCAQAICLEEMTETKILKGAIFYGKTRRRMDVEFDEKLRLKTETIAKELHDFIKEGKTPKAEYTKQCESCSLVDICIPKSASSQKNIENYINKMLED